MARARRRRVRKVSATRAKVSSAPKHRRAGAHPRKRPTGVKHGNRRTGTHLGPHRHRLHKRGVHYIRHHPRTGRVRRARMRQPHPQRIAHPRRTTRRRRR